MARRILVAALVALGGLLGLAKTRAADPPAADAAAPPDAQPAAEPAPADQPAENPAPAEPAVDPAPADQPAVDPAPAEPAPAAEAAAVEPAPDAAAQDETYELFLVLADTLDQIERNYVQDISRRELIEAAIQGMLTKLDPYSTYIGREEVEEFRGEIESQFGGIGIQIGVDNGRLTILSPLVGSPAYRAGLHSGDAITHIAGQATAGQNVDDIKSQLRGEPGTEVTLTVERPGAAEPLVVTLTREIIRVETVLGDTRHADDTWDFMLDDERHIGYVRVTTFGRDTTRDLENALQSLSGQELRGLILDLRFDPGGLLTSAIEVCDLFLREGTIVSTEGRNSPARTWEAHEPGTFEGFPMVVLVNRYSASAAEIVAACLQDHGRAIVVGERTWGKGSVQNVIDLEEGRSALKLTTAAYRRPSGKNIHRFPGAPESDEWGVTPDDGYLVPLNDDALAELARYRRDRDIAAVHGAPPAGEPPATQEPAAGDPAAAPAAAPFVDQQLQKALDYLSAELAAR
jgi:carboxyl-terminal processing protease